MSSHLPGYRPNRGAHRVLARLAQTPHERVERHELEEAADITPYNARGRSFSRVLSAMVRDDLICVNRWWQYWITDDGQEALALLDAGERVEAGDSPPVGVRRFG